MDQELQSKETAVQPDTGTQLAYERTFLAHERTQMAWIRTALALIGFGFTIGKFFEYLREKGGEAVTVLGPQTVGSMMIAMGLIALVLGSLQHFVALKRMRQRCPDLPRSVAWVTAMLLAVLGFAALINAILHM
ncbi:MAG: YidH family protein [Lysobacterales bacterium]